MVPAGHVRKLTSDGNLVVGHRDFLSDRSTKIFTWTIFTLDSWKVFHAQSVEIFSYAWKMFHVVYLGNLH